MKPCPKCGKPMRLEWDKRGDSWNRVWYCSDWYSLNSSCLTSERIPGDERFTITDIAEDMARQAYHSSSDQGKKQANYRRVAGGLKNIGMESRKYLSDDEYKELQAATDVLERLATAAEKAKKEKKRIEQEEKCRIQRRWGEAEQQTSFIVSSDDPVESVLNVIALSAFLNRHCPWSKGWLKRIRPRHNEKFIDAMWAEIRVELSEARRGLLDYIAWRNDPVPNMLTSVKEVLSEARNQHRIQSADLIDELQETLAVESAKNIVKLIR